MLQPIAIDTSSFSELRKNQCVYVDKTAYFHRLITRLDARRFFIARPRRFGKSLMISTLKALFEGRRELFDGLAITKTDWAWESYPVLYFNMGFAASSTAEGFKQNFPSLVSHAIKDAGGQYNAEESPASNFGFAIDSLSSGNRGVVILIDEYDDPVAQLLAKSDEAEEVRGIMADFYRQM